ncbi:hypothetical protein ACOMHN_004380 [Nucella lapillus]
MVQFADFRYAVLVSLAVLLWSAAGVAGKSVPNGALQAGDSLGQPPCPIFHFFDTGTELCEHCRDLCDHAKVWKTEEQCQTLCKDYVTAKQCRHGQYYDEQTGTCSPCDELCRHHDIRRTTVQCKTSCPDYQSQQKKAKDEVNTRSVDNDKMSTTQPHAGEDPQDLGKPAVESHSWIWIVLPILIGFIMVAAVALAVRRDLWFCPGHKQQPGTPVTDTESANSSEESRVPLKYPEVETHPGVCTELVTSGT